MCTMVHTMWVNGRLELVDISIVGEKRSRAWLLALAFLALCLGCAGDSMGQAGSAFRVHPQTPNMGPDLTHWAGRWSAATGIPIEVSEEPGPGVIEVRYVAEAIGVGPSGGKPVCGVTPMTVTRVHDTHELVAYEVQDIQVSFRPPPRCMTMFYTLGHEIGHMLSGPDAPHASSGVFADRQPPGPDYVIDAVSLAAVCDYARCTAFQPE